MVKVSLSRQFERSSKRLLKKYVSLRQEIGELLLQLRINPRLGTSLGDNCYKIRLAVRSKASGKSGGMRVITNVEIIVSAPPVPDAPDTVVYLAAIYDKSEQDNMTDAQLRKLLAELRAERAAE